MRLSFTLGIWFVSLACLVSGGLLASLFGLMATSVDPSEIITAGPELWTNAMLAALLFVGLLVVTTIGLALWHTRRFKAIGGALTLAEVVGVGWAYAKVYTEYF